MLRLADNLVLTALVYTMLTARIILASSAFIAADKGPEGQSLMMSVTDPIAMNQAHSGMNLLLDSISADTPVFIYSTRML